MLNVEFGGDVTYIKGVHKEFILAPVTSIHFIDISICCSALAAEMVSTPNFRQAGHLRGTISSTVSSSKTILGVLYPRSGLFSAFCGSVFVSTTRIERVYFFVVRLVGAFHVYEFLMCQL